MWWCFCASDDSDAWRVPANLARNLCRMSSRLPLLVAVCLYCQRWRRTAKGSRQRAGQQNSQSFLLLSSINRGRFMQITAAAAAALESTAQVAHIIWEISRKKAVEEQETSCQNPVPPATVHFYVPPSISITIAVTRPRAQHNGNRSAERRHAQRWGEEPAA